MTAQPTDAPVVVIGDALIDEIHDGDSSAEVVGGAALNVATGLVRLGVSATLIAMVGTDAAGDAIRTHLEAHGVKLLATPSLHGSARAVSVRIDGEPAYEFNDAARARAITIGDVERHAIAAAPCVVISSFPFDHAEQVETLATAVERRPLIVDPNPRVGLLTDAEAFTRGFETLASACALLKVGPDDAALLYHSSVEQLRARLARISPAVVLATAGATGASIEFRGDVITAPVAQLPGPVIDTMGAGDATLAAVVASLVQDTPEDVAEWRRILDRAMRIAAATVRHQGAMLRMPEPGEA